MSEEDEPHDVEQNGRDEKNSIGSAETLTATLNCNQRKQSNSQIYQQHSVVQCP